MKIIHLSDLHFGRQDTMVAGAVSREIAAAKPDLVIISGDFTQNGSTEEFALAKAFIQSLSAPVFVVPGNHDVPAHNLFERFFYPYRKYKSFIAQNLCPVLDTGDALIVGINTARRALFHWNWANGAISKGQREKLQSLFSAAPQPWKICVMHHPVHKADDSPLDVTVFGGRKAMRLIEDLGVDLVLTGHVHHASITIHGTGAAQTVYLSASTALSTRTRTQKNGFNVIIVNAQEIAIEALAFKDGAFPCLYRHTILQTPTL